MQIPGSRTAGSLALIECSGDLIQVPTDAADLGNTALQDGKFRGGERRQETQVRTDESLKPAPILKPAGRALSSFTRIPPVSDISKIRRVNNAKPVAPRLSTGVGNSLFGEAVTRIVTLNWGRLSNGSDGTSMVSKHLEKG